MFVTWTALELNHPAGRCPWEPEGALWAQTGLSGAGGAEVPDGVGLWWSALATWPDEVAARAAAPLEGPWTAWHVVLEPASFRGDAVLSGGARPFAHLPERGRTTGAAAVVTLAGLGTDEQRIGEFFRRFSALGRDVRSAPGHRASLVQAPDDGAALTFSAWSSLRAAVTWAYHRPDHSATVRRQEDYSLAETSGFLRCAVVASSGTLRGTDPLAGLTGSVVAKAATA